MKRYDEFMKIAGESFRMITTFPDLLRFNNLNEIKCDTNLRMQVDKLLERRKEIDESYIFINKQLIE